MSSEQPCRLVREALFVLVGFGVLAVQQAQVRRRELTATLRRVAPRDAA